MKESLYTELQQMLTEWRDRTLALHDLAHCTNEAEVKAAILKHKDVIRECM